jgi:hypothetical protein
LFFVTSDCPISNSYAPEINRIVSAYRDKRIAFYIVYVDPTVPLTKIKKHARDFEFQVPLLVDPTYSLIHSVRATVTPEVVVLGPDGKVLYRGRIDDLYYDYGKRRAEPTRRELRDALNAIMTRQPIVKATAEPFGCFIPQQK